MKFSRHSRMMSASVAVLVLAAMLPTFAQETAAPKQGNIVSISLRDGTTVSGATDLKFLEVETVYGKLKVPIADVLHVRIGTNSMPDLKKRIEALIVQLGDNSFQKREAASNELAKLGALAASQLQEATKSPDPEVVTRATVLLEQLAQRDETPPQDDELETKAFLVRGVLKLDALTIVSERGKIKIPKGELISAVVDDGGGMKLPTKGLVAHWKFDEAAGVAAKDSSGNGYHGALNGGVEWVRGKTGNGLRFNGENGYVAVKGVDLANKSFTLAAWVKCDPSKEIGTVMSQGPSQASHRLNFGFGGKQFYVSFHSDDLYVPHEPENKWRHWLTTYDAATRTQNLYRDGALVGSRVANAHYQGSGDLHIGQTSFEGHAYLKGILDDARIYNRALTKEEIKALAGGNR